jgi:predicted transcriptional regulator
MAIIKAPPKQPKSVTVQARVEESVKTQLDQYAQFIDSTPSYVIAEALKVLFKRDDEFKAWLGQQSSNGKIRELIGGGLKETA